ncbi:unnamed protein product, partial [Boreogadus saida]
MKTTKRTTEEGSLRGRSRPGQVDGGQSPQSHRRLGPPDMSGDGVVLEVVVTVVVE